MALIPSKQLIRRMVLFCTFLAATAMAQDVISLSSGSATVGGTASLDITLNSPAGSEPAGVQWTFNYSPTDVVAVNVTPGPSATAAGKAVTCQASSGKYTCILIGNNSTAIQGGVLGTATFQLAGSTSSSSVPVQFSATYGALATGSAVAVTGNNAIITVLPAAALSSLSCSPSSLAGAGTISCSVSLSSPAPAGGAAVSISDNSSSLTVPASVSIPAGGASTNFNATAVAVTTTTNVTISASYGGVTRTAAVQLQPPAAQTQPALSAIACNPYTVAAGGTTTCTVSLTAAAVAGGFSAALASNNAALMVPASITVPQGAAGASFAAQAGSPSTNQAVTVSASAGGLVRTCSVTVSAAVVTPPPPPPPATSGINFVQANGFTDNNSGSSASVAFNAVNTAGNIIIAAVSWGDADVASVSATDSAGNQYYVATDVFDKGQRQGLAILYAPNVKAYAGLNRVTVNLGAARGYRRLIVTEYSGVAATNPLDVTSTNVANSSTAVDGVTSKAATTTSNGQLIFGAVMDDYGTTSITAGTGFTQRASLNNKDLAVQDRVQATAGSIASTQTFGAKHRYLAHMATFKAASGGIVTPPPPPPPPPPTAAISFVQTNAYTDNNGGSSASVAFNAANTAGNIIIAAVSWGDAAADNLNATDSAGNQYYVATNVFDDGQRQGLAILYAPNVKAYAGLNLVTINLGGQRGYRRLIVTEYSGVAATSPLDVTSTNIANSTTAADAVTSRAATTRSNGQLIFGAVMDDYGTTSIAAGTGFTQRAAVNNKDLAVQDRVQAAAGSIASTQTFGASHRYLAHMATFRAQ